MFSLQSVLVVILALQLVQARPQPDGSGGMYIYIYTLNESPIKNLCLKVFAEHYVEMFRIYK